MEPNPREVATRLLHRDEFKPATTLNNLAAAWIQFQNHDWFSHGDNDPDRERRGPAARGRRRWREEAIRMRAHRARTRARRATRSAGTYVNTVTHWWDGSQIYGSSEETATASCAPARAAR